MARGGKGCDTAGCGNDADVPIGPDVVNGSVPDVLAKSAGGNGADVWGGGGGWGVGIEAIVGKEADVANGADVMVSSLIRRSDVGAGKSWVTRGGTVGCGRPTEVLYGSKGSEGNSREIVLVGASAEDESMRTVSARADSKSTSG